MELSTRPPGLALSVQRARQFYTRLNALPLYEHCHGVFQRAYQETIIDGRPINHFRDDSEGRKSALFNHILAETALYHVVDPEKLERAGACLQSLDDGHPLRNPAIREDLVVFSKLTKMDHAGAPAQEYAAVLNATPPPLALLARLADYAVTHRTEELTSAHVSGIESPVFRMYSSLVGATADLKCEAYAGEKIYAPVAELFGYPVLAGDIMKHAYRINHTLIHDHVVNMLAREHEDSRLGMTQTIARRLIKTLRRILTDSGFEVEVVPRLEKHPGKLMRKFFREMVKRHAELPPQSKPPLDEFLPSTIHEYSLSSITDAVALKVIVDRFRGAAIDDLPPGQKSLLIEAVVSMVTAQLKLLQMVEGYTSVYTPMNKPNGYTALHFDATPQSSSNLLPLEVQVKTRGWDDLASHGRAAHYHYIGGDQDLMASISNAYTGIISRRSNGDAGK